MVKEATRPATGAPAVSPMRPPSDVAWKDVKEQLKNEFGLKSSQLKEYDEVSKADLLKAYEMMQARACVCFACSTTYTTFETC
jgi:hypothetical protein